MFCAHILVLIATFLQNKRSQTRRKHDSQGQTKVWWRYHGCLSDANMPRSVAAERNGNSLTKFLPRRPISLHWSVSRQIIHHASRATYLVSLALNASDGWKKVGCSSVKNCRQKAHLVKWQYIFCILKPCRHVGGIINVNRNELKCGNLKNRMPRFVRWACNTARNSLQACVSLRR